MPLASGTGLKGRPAFLSPPLSACVRSQRSRRTPADSYSHALLSPSASSKRPVSAYNAAVSRTGGGVDLPVETGRLSSQSDSVRDAKRETQGASIGAETARMKNGTEIVLSIAGERDFVEILDTRNVLSADQLTGLTDFRGQTLDEVPDWDHRKQGFVRRLKTIDRPELSIVVARHKEKNRRPGERESRSEYSIGKRGRGGNASHEHVHGEMLGTADLLELREGNRPKGEVVLLR
uniref:Uncharacterized protein n=1 Tax=Chromera velia CCMP2878 TaxID=1169474 RepID=A0A0G4HVD7_9ALVE|eukprot:Cvel_8787.t1-p1 / transcript=Cvel_8787.t1 / gene=Cvel_8787 / organism=Chromera_velia_CCMP2878 / gene_product=hypothetical protein / transcript_product=hypothetical protein / location=Cvel_scaffold491:83674-85001(+) / protein_length=234 / sequence_SO=supercontig / SO=protein_coding / is_pseudo=false